MALEITPDEYRKWLSPLAAIRALEIEGLTANLARATILMRLTKGALSAAAYRTIAEFTVLNEEATSDFRRLDRDVWVGVKTDDSFWDTGEIRFRPRPSLSSYMTVETQCFGVRFDPIGMGLIVDFERERRAIGPKIPAQIYKAPAPMTPVGDFVRLPKSRDVITKEIVEAAARGPRISHAPTDDEIIMQYGYDTVATASESQAVPTSAAKHAPRKRSKAAKRNPVAQTEVTEWHLSLTAAKRAEGHRELHAAAKAHFRPRRVMKKLIDELTRGRKLGRPRKS